MSSGLPNLIIAGVTKAGTTSLFTYLARHDDIFASPIKETCYFLPLIRGKDLQPIEIYEEYFRSAGGQRYRMEATPGYFFGGRDIARTMREKLGNVRVIIVLREPVDRLFSCYRYFKGINVLPHSLAFEDFVERCLGHEDTAVTVPYGTFYPYEAIREGFYAERLPSWHESFAGSLRILFFDDLRKDPPGLMRELCAWLGISDSIYEGNDFAIENKSVPVKNRALHKMAVEANRRFEKYLRRHPGAKVAIREFYYRLNGARRGEAFPVSTRERLLSVYRPYNCRLRDQLAGMGISVLPEWLTEE